jgi:predicted aminopeptidase
VTRTLGRLRSLAFRLLPFTFCLAACSPTYVVRAGYEEARILWRRQPIQTMLRRTDLDSDTRTKLELALAVRAFAADALHLKVGGSFASFARVDPNQVVHVVSAAYRTRLEPYTWWFPIVGRVPYKGFFSKTCADEEAAWLEREGYDTYTRPSVAFSTLGWFADPLVSTLLRYDRVTLANVIIHELLHNTTYLAGHADFDESFANFVGTRGAMLFFATTGQGSALREASASWDDTLLLSDFLGRFTTHLREMYASGISASERERLFGEGQDEFRRLPFRTALYADFGTQRLNNAVILHYLMYADRLSEFDDVLQQKRNDLAQTIQTVINVVHQEAGDPFAALKRVVHAQAEHASSGAPLAQGSSAFTRSMPYRTEPTNTTTASASAALNEATTLVCLSTDNDVP